MESVQETLASIDLSKASNEVTFAPIATHLNEFASQHCVAVQPECYEIDVTSSAASIQMILMLTLGASKYTCCQHPRGGGGASCWVTDGQTQTDNVSRRPRLNSVPQNHCSKMYTHKTMTILTIRTGTLIRTSPNHACGFETLSAPFCWKTDPIHTLIYVPGTRGLRLESARFLAVPRAGGGGYRAGSAQHWCQPLGNTLRPSPM